MQPGPETDSSLDCEPAPDSSLLRPRSRARRVYRGTALPYPDESSNHQMQLDLRMRLLKPSLLAEFLLLELLVFW